MDPDTDIISPGPKAAHTPGPWVAEPQQAEGCFPTRHFITAIGGGRAPYWVASTDSNVANASLIAAGPTMLAALRLALPELAEDLIALVDGERIGGAADWQPEEPLPADLDSDDMDLLRAKKAAYDAVLAAIKHAEGR